MNIYILLFLVICGMVFFLTSIWFEHLIFGLLSIITWLIISVSTMVTEYPVGFTSISLQTISIGMFFYGISIIATLWFILLAKNEILTSVEVQK